MTHEDAFLQAILESPDDDTPRLIYADWLDEHGDPARAEFIRVQCRLTQIPLDDPVRSDLLLREELLLAEYVDEWLGELHRTLRRWQFRRGFLHAIVFWDPWYLTHQPILPLTVRRVGVELSHARIDPAIIAQLPERVARENVVIPLRINGHTITIAMRDPDDARRIAGIASAIDRDIEAVAADIAQIIGAINRHYGAGETEFVGSMLREVTDTTIDFSEGAPS
jgi:uncharacterized protein (TIGR02996 family)